MECVQLGNAIDEKSRATVHQAVQGILDMFEERLKAAEAVGQLRSGIDLNAAVRLVAGAFRPLVRVMGCSLIQKGLNGGESDCRP